MKNSYITGCQGWYEKQAATSSQQEELTKSNTFHLVQQVECGRCQETIDHLESLRTEWPCNEEISQVYANGLNNLTIKQDRADTKEWPGNEEI